MVFLRVRSSLILKQYLENTRVELGIDFPESYFETAWTFVAFEDGQMVAGYSLILQGPFRVLSSIPRTAENLEMIENLNSTSVEITGFWINKDHRNPRAILAILHNLAIHLNNAYQKFGKTRAVYAYGFEENNLMRIYKRAQPTPVYSGETLLQPGMPAVAQEHIEYIEILALQEILNARYGKVQRWL
jgi:hypothetical protein